MDPILEQFLTEARDNLEYLDKHLEELNGGDEETINALFRAAHTLKGGAGLVGLNAVKEVTHAAEDLLDAYRNKKIEYSDEMIDILYDAFDEVVELIDAVEELGSIDIQVDEDTINNLKNSIRGFLSGDTSESQEDNISTSLNINEDINTELFNPLQIQKISKYLPIYTPTLSKEFQENDNWYLMDLDLDMDTLRLGNDPLYLFYLLETNDFEVAIQTNCELIQEDNLNWASRIVACVKSNEEKILDSFFNIIDEIGFRYLSIEALFDNDYENIENEMFDEFKNEFIDILVNKKYDILDEKLSAIIQVLNLESKEGFILHRLQTILTNFDIKSEEYKQILKIVADKLSINLEISQESKETSQTEQKNEIELNDEDKENLKELLKAQIKILNLATDEVVLERTKLVVKNIMSYLNKEIDLSTMDKNQLVDYINSLLEEFGEKIQQIKQPKSEEKPKPSLQKPQTNTSHKSATPKTVKIEQSQIDELMDIVGELLVVKNAFPYISEILSPNNIEESKRELNTKYEEISRIIEQLQDRVMQMRLLPLEYIFGRYPKLVRDISKKLNKKIKYIESGGDTKLDKTVIEKLADPLVHIIRNSLDHGIETPDIREANGKNPEGTLEIKATSQGDKVFIIIKDDGAGIDVDKVVNKALEKRLVTPETLDKMTREEKLKLIFLPGLSTKDEITELSGRGVGTDAVKKVIEELGGKIYMKSQVGYGTEIKLELPLSVALTNVFHVMMNNVNYAVPMDYIVETVKMQKSDIQIANHNPFIKIRGELIPLLLEEELLGYDKIKDANPIVIIKFNDKKVGFVVDEFVGQLDVVQKPLTGVISAHPFISGVSLLGNGDILFILDITKILKDIND